MKRLLPPFVLVFVGACAANQPSAPRANTPPGAPAASTSTKTSTCEGPALTLEEVFVDACRIATKPDDTSQPTNVGLELSLNPSYVSGQGARLGVAYVNRSDKNAELVFNHHCLGLEPNQRFELVVVPSHGKGAALQQQRPPVERLEDPCKLPYVRVTLPPGGRISTSVPFEVSANTPIGSAPEGPLAPGTYSVEATGPLARDPRLTAKVSLVVVKQ